MSVKDKIQLVNKEASLYKAQGMYEEALEKYMELLELVSGVENIKIKNIKELHKKIRKKIKEVKDRLDFYQTDAAFDQIPEEAKDIVKKLFSQRRDDPEYEKFDEALTLARFGRFNDAIEEMTPFLLNKKIRMDAARNILNCYRELDQKDKASSVLDKWREDSVITEKEFLILEGKKNSIESAAEQLVEDDIVVFDEEDDPSETMEIDSVGIQLSSSENIKPAPIELDVSFQAGNHLSLIISSREKKIIDNMDVGLRLNDVCFYSPIAVFKSSGIVLSKHQIESGPKKGDWCLDIEIKNPT